LRLTRTALRIRVSMSAIGSLRLMIQILLPTGLLQAGDFALIGQHPQTDPADAELAIHGPGPAAQFASSLDAGTELRGLRGPISLRLGCH
jgi:hypothetical protein